MQWSRLSVELVPIMAGVVGSRISRQLPTLLEEGWAGFLNSAPGLAERSMFRQVGPFAVTAAVVVVLAAGQVEAAPLAGVAVFLSGMAILALTDMEHRVVPDLVTYPLMGAGVLAAGLGASLISLQSAVLGTAIGWCCGKVGQVLARAVSWSTGQGTEFGAGDVKVLAVTGAWLGGLAAYAALLLAIGAVCLTTWWARRFSKGDWCESAPLASYLFAAAAGLAGVSAAVPLQAVP